MNKTLNKVLLAVLIIMGAFYYFQNSNNDYICSDNEGEIAENQQACDKSSEAIILDALSKSYPVSVIYPENERPVLLDTVEQIEQSTYLRGQFDVLVSPAQGDSGPVYDRGTVSLNMSELALLSDNQTEMTYFAAPFVINTVGSGVFTYVGLFSYDFNTQQTTHLSSELLGNRVREEKIIIEEKSVVKDNVFVQEGVIQVTFQSYGEQQSAAEYPQKNNKVTLQLVALDPKNNENATFRAIKTELNGKNEMNDEANTCIENDNCRDNSDSPAKLN